MLSTAAPRYGDDGAFLGYVGSVIDVDERRRAEEALRQSEGRLRRAQEAGGIGDWELDLATEAVYWSDSSTVCSPSSPARSGPVGRLCAS